MLVTLNGKNKRNGHAILQLCNAMILSLSLSFYFPSHSLLSFFRLFLFSDERIQALNYVTSFSLRVNSQSKHLYKQEGQQPKRGQLTFHFSRFFLPFDFQAVLFIRFEFRPNISILSTLFDLKI